MKVNNIICLDLEGVLFPEIWEEASKHFEVIELSQTTRDIADYNQLMELRIKALQDNNITINDLLALVKKLDPLPGAVEFVTEVRKHTQFMIISDAFIQFFKEISPKFNYPTVFCNRLIIDKKGYVGKHLMRSSLGKKGVVEQLHVQNFTVGAAGDSYNDVGMLESAEVGYFFNSPESIRNQFPHIPFTTDYNVLIEQFASLFDW